MLALGGEMYGYSMISTQSMECYTLGYQGWRNVIPKAVALSGITLIHLKKKFPVMYLSLFTVLTTVGVYS